MSAAWQMIMVDHPGLGEGGKYHIKKGRILPEDKDSSLCAGWQPELR